MSKLPTISVSMGDPGGIGPEVLVRALADHSRRKRARFQIHGSAMVMHHAAEVCGVDPFWWQVDARSPLASTLDVHQVVLMDSDPQMKDEGVELTMSKSANQISGAMSFHWVNKAIQDTMRPDGDPLKSHGIVTAPINKLAWSIAGKNYPGHTELVAKILGQRRFAMMFVGNKLRVVLATVHIALNDIRDVLTIGKVHTAIDLGYQACLDLGIKRPKIAVCGLNPHAGEDGLMGDEEQRIIKPAMDLARSATEGKMIVEGPFPADTIFRPAMEGKYDLVVAMYHDQGLIPVKLLERDEAVNITLGLGEVVRTSPDHGTAFDIAGQGIADPGSMSSAIDLAIQLCQAQNPVPASGAGI
ncbi:MAG: 4-hydroxythreonine-4-phosphate dehydrogenase PdxA [Phycisphaerales bacterium]